MNSPAFHRPRTIEEAVSLLSLDHDARPLAGGASLVAMMNAKLLAPSALVSLRDVTDLRASRVEADGSIRIGAMMRHRETSDSQVLSGTLGCVRAAAANIANPPIRNMGTMGGSISLADPGADYPAALVAARASIEIAGTTGMRRIPAQEFFTDWYATALEPGELVSAVLLPKPKPGVGIYRKLARVAGDFAMVSVALTLEREGTATVAIGGCGPRPVFDEEANLLVSKGRGDPEAMRMAGQILTQRSDPVDDVRASAVYRRTIIPRLLTRTITEAYGLLESSP
jgi:carbon-monoxide dehydrogenase medium subunit